MLRVSTRKNGRAPSARMENSDEATRLRSRRRRKNHKRKTESEMKTTVPTAAPATAPARGELARAPPGRAVGAGDAVLGAGGAVLGAGVAKWVAEFGGKEAAVLSAADDVVTVFWIVKELELDEDLAVVVCSVTVARGVCSFVKVKGG